ncbi:sensor histidine kinase [Nitriliruptor alkaliphilus]|uniref:sensor histidine kinase n=1 Tax=Nitriliruptor alkaliphilus TaxID=427918 RepID=UPI000695D2D2|nr:ATP-binding protein [Nitriliruptor alkaliphilus]
MLDLALVMAVAVGFAAMAVLAVARYVADRQPGARELVAVLGTYATIAALVSVQAAVPGPRWLHQLTELSLAPLLAVLPLLVIRFAAVYDDLARRFLPVARLVTVPFFVAMTVVVTGVLPDPVASAVMGSFVVLWIVAHALAAASLFVGARRTATAVTRRRSQLMAAGTAGLGSVLVVAAAEGNLVGGPEVTWTLASTALAAMLFLAGFAPPKVLRWHWSRSDRGSLEAAELRLVTLDDPHHLAAELLPHLLRFTGGGAAWLVGENDEVVASSGAGQAGPPRVATTDSRGDGEVRVLRDPGGGPPVLVVATPHARLVMTADPYALLFGAGDLDAVRLLATRLDLAVDRARLRADEVERVHELADAQRVLEVERLREDVLATVSHELRTPLTTVCGASELLLSRWHEVDDRQRLELVARIAANAADLRRVVQEVLDLIALRLASPANAPRPVAVAAFLEELIAGLGDTVARHHVVVEATGDLAAVLDTEVLRRMLEHLVSNAAKFSAPGSAIELQVRATARDLEIEVGDVGVGMTGEDLARVFEPFCRSGNVLVRETRGIGLGLALVAALAETAGIRLHVASEPGAGTTVTLTVPGAVAAARRLHLATR